MKKKLLMAVSSLITVTLSLLPVKAKANDANTTQPNGVDATAGNEGDITSVDDEAIYEGLMQNINPNNQYVSDDHDVMRHGR